MPNPKGSKLPAWATALERQVFDSKSVATFKWLSLHANVPINDAKRMLFAFYKRYKADGRLSATFLLAGELTSAPGQHTVMLVPEDKYEEHRKALAVLTCEHLYSIAPAGAERGLATALVAEDLHARGVGVAELQRATAVTCAAAVVRADARPVFETEASIDDALPHQMLKRASPKKEISAASFFGGGSSSKASATTVPAAKKAAATAASAMSAMFAKAKSKEDTTKEDTQREESAPAAAAAKPGVPKMFAKAKSKEDAKKKEEPKPAAEAPAASAPLKRRARIVCSDDEDDDEEDHEPPAAQAVAAAKPTTSETKEAKEADAMDDGEEHHEAQNDSANEEDELDEEALAAALLEDDGEEEAEEEREEQRAPTPKLPSPQKPTAVQQKPKLVSEPTEQLHTERSSPAKRRAEDDAGAAPKKARAEPKVEPPKRSVASELQLAKAAVQARKVTPTSAAAAATASTQDTPMDVDGPKKVIRIERRQVTKTFVDSKGYMVTEPVWEEYEVEVDAAAAAPQQHAKKEDKPPAPLAKPKTKQASINSFFAKK